MYGTAYSLRKYYSTKKIEALSFALLRELDSLRNPQVIKYASAISFTPPS